MQLPSCYFSVTIKHVTVSLKVAQHLTSACQAAIPSTRKNEDARNLDTLRFNSEAGEITAIDDSDANHRGAV
jgi:hypothetical protein